MKLQEADKAFNRLVYKTLRELIPEIPERCRSITLRISMDTPVSVECSFLTGEVKDDEAMTDTKTICVEKAIRRHNLRNVDIVDYELRTVDMGDTLPGQDPHPITHEITSGGITYQSMHPYGIWFDKCTGEFVTITIKSCSTNATTKEGTAQ